MREHCFQALDKEGTWRYGRLAYLFADGVAKDAIQSEKGGIWEIDPSTVAEYTGACDMQGDMIFEGDILRDEEDEEYLACFHDGKFVAMADGDTYTLTDIALMSCIVGNRWDNPDMLLDDEEI